MSVLLLSGHKNTTFIHKNQEIIDFFYFLASSTVRPKEAKRRSKLERI